MTENHAEVIYRSTRCARVCQNTDNNDEVNVNIHEEEQIEMKAEVIEVERKRQIEIETQREIEIERQRQIEIERQRQIEIERQRQIKLEVERKIQAEIERQRQVKLEEERKKQEEIERQRQIEIERQRQIEIERQRLIETETERQKQIQIQKQKEEVHCGCCGRKEESEKEKKKKEKEREKKKKEKEEAKKKKEEEEKREEEYEESSGELRGKTRALMFVLDLILMVFCSGITLLLIYYDIHIFRSENSVDPKKDVFTFVFYGLLGFGYLFFLIIGTIDYLKEDFEFYNVIELVVLIVAICLPLCYICSFEVYFFDCCGFAISSIFLFTTLSLVSLCVNSYNYFLVFFFLIIFSGSIVGIMMCFVNEDTSETLTEKLNRKEIELSFESGCCAIIPALFLEYFLIGISLNFFNNKRKIKGKNFFNKRVVLYRFCLFLVFSFPFAIFVYLFWFFRWLFKKANKIFGWVTYKEDGSWECNCLEFLKCCCELFLACLCCCFICCCSCLGGASTENKESANHSTRREENNENNENVGIAHIQEFTEFHVGPDEVRFRQGYRASYREVRN